MRIHELLEPKIDEVAKVSLSTDPKNFGAWVNDSGDPEKTVVIPTSKIHVFEPDSKFDDPHHAKNLANIVKAIKAGKKLPPILVRRHGIDRFQVVDGHHRFMAYRMAGVKAIPARVVDPKNITVDETLKKVKGKWALVSKHDPNKVLQYYHGSGHPSKEWISKVERRVHSFGEDQQS